MARTREFDTAKVLSQAAAVFARGGYAGTSIDQLVQATGLRRGSLYGAFQSKAGLFTAAFRSCLEQRDVPLVTDLLIVALWERAGVDGVVRALCTTAIQTVEAEEKEPIKEVIFARLIEQAKLK